MTKSTITRDELNEVIATYGKHHIAHRMANLLLAAMDSEPVAWLLSGGGAKNVVCFDSGNAYADPLRDVTPLYRHAQPAPEYPETLPCPVLLEPGLRFSKGIKTSTMLAALARRAVHESDMAALSPEERVEFQARIEDFKALIAQPAPVVPDDVSIFEAAIEECKKCDSIDEHAWNHGVLAAIAKYESCRAAMLQELKKSAGTEAICRSDENVQVLHTKSPAQSDCWPAQNDVAPAQSPIDHGYLPECECSGCKATARICAELAGNSQVIPDGYVMVPDDLKEAAADLLATLDDYQEQLVPINRDSSVVRALRAAMLAAAPQEVKGE